jgi:hypothetical protein
METILEDIKCMPGVTNVFYFDTLAGITARKTSPLFTDEDLSAVGRTLMKIFAAGRDVFTDIETLRLRYNESSLLVACTGTRYLVVIHDQTLNPNLLNMTLANVFHGMKRPPDPSTDRGSEDFSAEIPPEEERAVKNKKIEAALGTDPFPKVLAIMKNSLGKVMGPMAGIVFDDALKEWIDGIDDPSHVSIEKLVRKLFSEIGDPEKISDYKNLIAPVLKFS